MQCFIYKSSRKEELYVYLDKRDDFSSLPDALKQNLGQLIFVMELQLSPERKLAREDVAKVMDNIRNKGFFVQMPPTIASLLSTAPTNPLLH
jgi:uncharacterized protein YcgL (UPF0745 family)